MNQTIKNRIDQIKRGQVPIGYEKTSFGIFPIGWEKNTKLKKICDFCGGGTPSTKNLTFWQGKIPWISSSDLEDNNIRKVKISRYISEEAIKKSATKLCPKGSLLIVSRVGVGKLAIAPTEICTSQDFTNIIKADCNIYFLAYMLTKTINIQINKSQGTSIKGLSSEEIKKIKVAYPKSQIEQQQIANVLMVWDKAIEAQNQYIIAREKKKKALMQKLLRPKPHWQKIKLGNIIKEVTTRNSDGKSRVVSSISNTRGFIPQSEQFNKEVASKDTCNYKVISKGSFAYNPSRINVGSLAYYDKDDEVIVSPMYIVFKSNESKLLSDFLHYWLQSHFFSGQMKAFLSGSVRNSLNFKDLSLFKFALPTNKEQKEIASILSMADAEISMEKAKLELYKLQKKSLMQLLLTGIVRTMDS